MGTLLLMSSSRERSFSALTLWNKGWRERIFAPGFMIVLPADSQGRLALPVRLQQIFFEVEGRKGFRSMPRVATTCMEIPRVSPAAWRLVFVLLPGSCSLRDLFSSRASF